MHIAVKKKIKQLLKPVNVILVMSFGGNITNSV